MGDRLVARPANNTTKCSFNHRPRNATCVFLQPWTTYMGQKNCTLLLLNIFSKCAIEPARLRGEWHIASQVSREKSKVLPEPHGPRNGADPQLTLGDHGYGASASSGVSAYSSAVRPVPIYTARWRRHTGVNNLPRVTTKAVPGETWTCDQLSGIWCFTEWTTRMSRKT